MVARDRGYQRCDQSYVTTDTVDDQVVTALSTLEIPVGFRERVEDAVRQRVENPESIRRMEKIEAIVKRIDFSWEQGFLSPEEYVEKRQQLQRGIESLRPVDYDDLMEAADLLSNFNHYWQECEVVGDVAPARQQLMAKIIDRVFVYDNQESDLAAIAEEITALARQRYQQHESMRQTIRSEFDGDEISTRVALYRWWELDDEKALSDEIQRRFDQEIPLNKRSEWRGFLAEQKAGHQDLSGQIIALETRINAIVYDALDLTPEERQLIEETTKYPYGEV